jgi:hypothetical protein
VIALPSMFSAFYAPLPLPPLGITAAATGLFPKVPAVVPPFTQTLQEQLDRGDRPGNNARSEWAVAALRCYELGLGLRGAPQPPCQERLSVDPSTALLGEVLAASICHSTNWDRLRASVSRAARDPEWFAAHRLARLTPTEFQEAFGDGLADDSTFVGRYRLFTETAGLVVAGELRLDGLLDGATRVGGEGGLYDRLGRIPAFSRDPEQKKARILVQELCRTALIDPIDPASIRPAVEYHLIRLYLRTERVLPTRAEDRSRLTTATTFRAPVIGRVRRAVESAMYFTASAAEISIPHLNQLEWQIARSYCVRGNPRCGGPFDPEKPCDETVLALANGGRCPFADLCAASDDSSGLARLIEPQLSSRHDFY